MIHFLQKNKPAGYFAFALASFATYILFNNGIAFLARLANGDFSSFYFYVSGNLCLASLQHFEYNNAYLIYFIVVLVLKFSTALLLIHFFKEKWLLLSFAIGLLWYDLFGIICFYSIAAGSNASLFFYGFSAVPFMVSSKSITHSFYLLPVISIALSIFFLLKYLPDRNKITLFILLSVISVLFTSLILHLLFG